VAERHLGVTPVVRRRDGSIRCVLIYRHKAGTQPIRKFAGAHVDEQGQKQLIETLGTGQQVVLEGPHAKGAMHYWEGDRELVDHLDEIPQITVKMVGEFYRELDELAVKVFGFEKHKLSLPGGGGNRAAAVSITNLTSPHLATDKELLARAIKAIDINDPRLADYDPWCALFRAMWAACGGDRQFYDEHIWPWLADNPANTPEEMELKLASFKDSQLGVEFVYEWASVFGFMEPIGTLRANDFTPDPGAAEPGETSAQGGDGAAVPPTPTGNGPTPFQYTDLALADRFAAEHPDWRFTPDEGWMRLKSGVYVPDRTILYPIGQLCSAVGDPYRTEAGPYRREAEEREQAWLR
jgi:hypothetical protein